MSAFGNLISYSKADLVPCVVPSRFLVLVENYAYGQDVVLKSVRCEVKSLTCKLCSPICTMVPNYHQKFFFIQVYP